MPTMRADVVVRRGVTQPQRVRDFPLLRQGLQCIIRPAPKLVARSPKGRALRAVGQLGRGYFGASSAWLRFELNELSGLRWTLAQPCTPRRSAEPRPLASRRALGPGSHRESAIASQDARSAT